MLARSTEFTKKLKGLAYAGMDGDKFAFADFIRSGSFPHIDDAIAFLVSHVQERPLVGERWNRLLDAWNAARDEKELAAELADSAPVPNP